MKYSERNIILEKSIEFSLDIIKYVELLELNKKYVIANQLLKSGTSIGANLHEAQQSESKKDFIHKLKIASKEIEETKYWLLLCERAEQYPNCVKLQEDLVEIAKILNKIISTTKLNIGND